MKICNDFMNKYNDYMNKYNLNKKLYIIYELG